MYAVKMLPEGHKPVGTLDLSKNKMALIAVQLAALLLLFVFAWLFGSLTNALRVNGLNIVNLSRKQMFRDVLVALVLMVVIHEAIHGLFFWIFTRERPKFGFKGAYAYAAAPDWYLPRNQYVVVSLAPLVTLTAIGITLLLFVPPPSLFLVFVITVVNAASSLGDMVMAGWVIVKPETTLVQDVGDAITVYV